MNLEKVLRTAFLVPQGDPRSELCVWGLPIILWGLPGIGKSSRVRAVSAALGLPLETLIAILLEPPDVGGAIMEDKAKGGATRVLALPEVKRLVENGMGILFLDEIGLASHSVQSALQGAVLEREFGDVRLPGQVRIVSASNDSDSVAESWGLTCPMANRFCHISVPLNAVSEWGKAMERKMGKREKSDSELDDTDFITLQERVAADWEKQFYSSYLIVRSFLEKNSGLLHKLPKDDAMRRKAWPSDRGWEAFVRTQATGAILDEPDATNTLLEGIVGVEATVAYKKYKKDLDLPSVNAVLDGAWMPGDRLDQAYVVYNNLRAYLDTVPLSGQTLDLSVKAWKAVSAAADKGYLDLACSVMHPLSGWPHGSKPEVAQWSDPLYRRTQRSDMVRGARGRL